MKNSFRLNTLPFFYSFILLIYFNPVIALSANIPEFSKSEKEIIQSLSSSSYSNKSDPTNRFVNQPKAIKFGKKLFFDPRLSGNHKISCATCHNPNKGWSNHLAITNLHPKHLAKRHTPSLWGVRYNRWYFWDGRADTLWSQALAPIENRAEMAGSRIQVARLMIKDKKLRKTYQKIFGKLPKILVHSKLPKRGKPKQKSWEKLSTPLQQEINRLFVNIGKAIASFETTIIAPNTAFDQFAKQLQQGNLKKPKISATAMRGLKLFIGKGACVNCHSGANFSDGEFHHSFLDKKDRGRYDGIPLLLKNPFNSQSVYADNDQKNKTNKLDYVYRNIAFKNQFKTPSLRNIILTYPYMHTGELKTLSDVLNFYNNVSKRMDADEHKEILLASINLSSKEQQEIIAFLKTLTDTSTMDFRL